jgi:glycosyltransferase involved in cell wall biosynthesis
MDVELEEHPIAGPLHVLVMVDDDMLRRVGPTMRQLCVGFVDEPIRTTVLCPNKTDPHMLLVGMTNHLTHGSLRWPLRDRSIRRVIDALGSDDPDLVHVYSRRLIDSAKALATHFDIPMVVQLAGLDDVAVLGTEPGGAACAYIAFTTPILQAAQRVLGERADRVTLIRPGMHAKASPTCFADDQRTATLISFTRFTPQCGLINLLEATAALIRRGEDLLLFLLGSGPLEPRLRRRVIELGLLKSVTFTGTVANRQAAMDSADILVSTRRQTELRSHALEGMAAGMAIVAARGSIDDALIDDQTALLFDTASPDQLTIQLSQLLEHRDMARQLAARAQEHVRQHHQPSAMVSAIAQLYRRLAVKQRTVKLAAPS